MKLSLAFSLDGPSLILRAPKEKDIPHIFSATQYPGFNDGMVWEPPTHIDELFSPLVRHQNAWKKGEAYGFAIENKLTNKFLGRISLRPTENSKTWDIGYWTHPEMQSKGVMTEAVGMVLKFAFEELSVEQVVAAYATWNKASQRVLEKNGFIYLKHIPQGFKKNGQWVEEIMMIRHKEK